MYDFTTFDSFITTTNGLSIGHGECWDYINLIWAHLGGVYYTYPPSDPSATNHGVKWGVLNSEALAVNQITGLRYISNKADLKRGDIVVTTGGDFGHAGFINENWSGDKTYAIYSQNYNGRRSVGLDFYNLNEFGGAFRYEAWNPIPPITIKRKNFPWVIYANIIRNRIRQTVL